MDEILFSFVVPCYNVQDYLNECVKSILEQTYHNYEVILVDDGSTDLTAQLCDQWMRSDERIYSYHKKNGGLSDARNYGLEKAKGDYIIFVDSDDFISKSTLSYFSDCIQKSYPDVLLTRLTEYYGKGNIVEQDMEMDSFFKDSISPEKALLWDMIKSKSSWPAPKKIVSRKFLLKYKLQFLKGFLHEDMDWSSRVMIHAETFEVCTKSWYYHRMKRQGSITNTISSKRLTDVIEMAARLIYGKEIRCASNKRREIISNRIMRSVYPILSFYGKLTKEEKARVIECCIKYKKIFRIAPNRKYKIFVFCVRILGFRISLSLLARIGGIV